MSLESIHIDTWFACLFIFLFVDAGRQLSVDAQTTESAFLAKVASALSTFPHMPHPAPRLPGPTLHSAHKMLIINCFFFSHGSSPQHVVSLGTNFCTYLWTADLASLCNCMFKGDETHVFTLHLKPVAHVNCHRWGKLKLGESEIF